MSLKLATSHRSSLEGALARAARYAAGTWRALQNRRNIHVLLEMDERCLKDIGLMRSDVVGALAQSLGRDPSTVLMVRSVERRARARALDVSVGRRMRLAEAPLPR